ncbi:hypothetical protein B0T25DRAFT_128463 [Lasiosphaeria hispida]|uniref:Uncharacterized protein n=1 Tax=Lasiosphaeria hispida TaxID=260671 RepID=A0AAJ0MIT0_9PEZI|nr:hypothetical protein B0T25DRAFT_128463 [Lasiosphaeria hispida]
MVSHLLLPEKAPEHRFTAADMATHLRKLRRGAAEYIDPQAAPGTLPEMRCFDPNRYYCLDFGDIYAANALHQWSFTPGLCKGTTGQCCRIDACLWLAPLIPGSGRSGTESAKTEAHHARTFLRHMNAALCGWSANVELCPTEGCCLEISYQWRIATAVLTWPNRLPYSWCEAINPDSYRLLEDIKNHGTLWRLDTSYTNYYCYLERPIVRDCYGMAMENFYRKFPLSLSQ